MNTEFASANLTAGQLNAIVKKIGGYDRALRFLRDELIAYEPPRLWREENGVIYLSVTSDGTTGVRWVERLEKKGFRISSGAKSLFCTKGFEPTVGITTEIAIIKETNYPRRDIVFEALLRRLREPNAEVVCLIRELLRDEDIWYMGLHSLAVKHKPIKDPLGMECLLRISVLAGGSELDTTYPLLGAGIPGNGRAFLISQA